MSPDDKMRPTGVSAPNNLYTVILALVFVVVLVTAALVSFKCYSQYGVIFKAP
jgi:hypothetical protein